MSQVETSYEGHSFCGGLSWSSVRELIGQGLRERYQVPNEIPAKLLALIRKLEAIENKSPRPRTLIGTLDAVEGAPAMLAIYWRLFQRSHGSALSFGVNHVRACPSCSVQQGFASAIENVRDANFRLMDMARANLDATFDFVSDLATATRPSDLLEAWSSHTSKQAEMLTKQTHELTALSQQFAGTMAEPVKRTTKAFQRG